MKITVIGAGSWGTALALHFAHHNNEVALWTRNPDQIRALQADRENKRGLPGFPFPESLTVHADLGEALKDSQLALIVTSVAGLRSSAELLKQHNAADIPVLAACKGFEQDTGLLTFQVLKEVLPNNKKIGVLSGPSFAQELAKQLPCAVVVASENQEWIEELVPMRNITEKMITTLPIILLMSTIPPLSNFPRTLSISQVSPNHHISAPKTMPVYPPTISHGLLGTTKANCAKVAMKRKMISGLEKVTRKAVMPLCINVPLPLPL